MNKARLLLAGIVFSAALGGVFAFKARANVYYYFTAGGYFPTTVTITCVTGSTGCTWVVNGVVRELKLWVNGVYVPLKRI